MVGLGVRQEDHVEAGVGGGQTASLPPSPPDLEVRLEVGPASRREEGTPGTEPAREITSSILLFIIGALNTFFLSP